MEDFSRTRIHEKVEEEAEAEDKSSPQPPNEALSLAASTVTLETPMIKPNDQEALQTAESVQSLAETYVLDANETLAAEGIPPVVIYDSMEKLLKNDTSVMETSNTCTLPYQGTMTSGSGDGGGVEVNEDLQVEVDSLSMEEVNFVRVCV